MKLFFFLWQHTLVAKNLIKTKQNGRHHYPYDGGLHYGDRLSEEKGTAGVLAVCLSKPAIARGVQKVV